MPKRIYLLSLLIILGLGSIPQPVLAQALLPYSLQLDAKELEQQGLNLAQDAVQLTRFQQYELAIQRANLATQLAPKSYQPWFLLGSLYIQSQKFDQAIEALQKARSLAPKEAGILFSLGSAKFQKGNYTSAVAD